MVALRFKAGTLVARLDTTLFPGLLAFCQIAEEVLGINEVWITSVNEGRHKSQSLHYAGRAVDIRRNIYPEDLAKEVTRRFKALYDSEYDLIEEAVGQPNEHWHLEFDPGNKNR